MRGELGFDGLIVSDAMDMRAIADRYGAAQASIMAKRAGIDIVIPMGDSANQIAVAQALLAAVESGELAESMFAVSAARIDHLRAEYDLVEATPTPAPISAEQTQLGIDLARRCLGVEEGSVALPLDASTALLVIDCLQPRFSNVEEAVAQADLLREMVLEVLPRSRYLSLLPSDAPEKWQEAARVGPQHSGDFTGESQRGLCGSTGGTCGGVDASFPTFDSSSRAFAA